jgi:hypothetical protein
MEINLPVSAMYVEVYRIVISVAEYQNFAHRLVFRKECCHVFPEQRDK